MAYLRALVFLALLLSCAKAQTTELLTISTSQLLSGQAEQLSTSDKDKLCGFVEGSSSDKAVALEHDTRVKVLKRSRFLQQQTVYDRENSTSNISRRLYKVALVEVLSGERKGSIGWVVVSYRDSGENPVVFLREAPPLE